MLGRGQYADAELGARAELATLTRNGNDGSLQAAEVLDVLVAAFWRGGKASNQEAVTSAERAIDIKERLRGRNDPALATSLDNAGVLFFVRADYERAQRLYERALTIWEGSAAKDPRYKTDIGKARSHLGPLFQELGQYSTARQHYEHALQAFLQTLGRDDAQIAMTRNNLATLMAKIGDYDEALRLYQESLASLEMQLGSAHPLIATAKHNLAELSQRMGRDGEAVELYRQSVALKEKTLGPAHPSLALTLGNLSYLHSDRREVDAAESLAQRALQIHETAYGARHVELAYSLVSLGRAQAARGDTAAARSTLTRALDLRTEMLGADNPLLVAPLHFLSEALVAGGEQSAAFDLALRAEAIAREHLRLTARGAPERQALRYAAERLSSLDTAVSIATERNTAAISSRSWDALIRSRAVVLDEMATRHRLAARQTSPSVRNAFDGYRAASERFANLLLRGPTSGGIDEYRRRIAGLRADKEAAERAVAAESEIVRRGLAEQEISYDAVRAALPGNATLVAYARIDRNTRSSVRAAEYVAFVLDGTSESPRIVALGAARAIETAIRRWRDELTPRAAADGRGSYRRAGEQLRELIWDPLRIDAKDDRLVLVVPAGAVHLVNFAALPTRNDKFLAEADLLIHYLSSERDLIGRDPGTANRQLLVLGGIAAASASSERRGTGEDCRTLSPADFPMLPGSLREARRIASIWTTAPGTDDRPLVELFGTSATEAAFKQQAAGKAVVHLATHGFFAANECANDQVATRSPLRLSGLVFSADSKPRLAGAEDGVLLAEEVATMDFSHAQWVVLSGCDTGVGQIQVDEGILGLRRAFHIAGARTLVMSLWPAEDLSAEVFMSSLYEARLQSRLSTVASIRQAYRNALAATQRTYGHSHPLYWAPFIASGDWR
jgi:CHAT domain-containing protein